MMRVVATGLAAIVLGHIAGAWLVARRDDTPAISWTLIRIVSGLLLLTIAFLLCLVLSLPWFLGPAAVLVGTGLRHGADAVRRPRLRFAFSWDVVAAAALGAVLVAPIVVSASRMAPGDVPPVFFNVDTPYALEQVHSLTKATTYPPGSLSNLGGGRSYHFATMGMAALISRSTGVRPHQALFALVLPLLALATAASAFAAAHTIAPALPAWLAVPLLLVAIPSFWYSFSDVAGPMVWEAIATRQGAPLAELITNYELWGPASIVAQNVGAHMLVLASLAAVAAAPARGWTLPAFLVGTGILVKVSTGVALVAGILLVQAWRGITTRQLSALVPAAAIAAVFFSTYAAFWILPATPADFAVEPFALFHLQRISERNGLTGLVFDVVWVMLPVLVVALAGFADSERPRQRDRLECVISSQAFVGQDVTARVERRQADIVTSEAQPARRCLPRSTRPSLASLPLLLLALAPFLVVNSTASIDQRPGGGGASDDWLQVLLPVPFLLHAFVLAFASARWTRLPVAFRAAFLFLVVVTIAPPIAIAGRYARVLIGEPESGHEFVDNAQLAPALAAIPTDGSLLVTNDLRYPAQRFGRDNRQMQIPALYGHQAFAVNYAYEVYSFSPERRALQALLQTEHWTGAIDDAARTHGWTHLLIRKDYSHPSPIPLRQIFENEHYAVYRF